MLTPAHGGNIEDVKAKRCEFSNLRHERHLFSLMRKTPLKIVLVFAALEEYT